MWNIRKFKLTIPQRLLLLTIIPIIGLIGLGQMSFRTVYTEYKNFAHDAVFLATFHREVADFLVVARQLSVERDAALRLFVARQDQQRVSEYRAAFAESDRLVAAMSTKLDRLAGSPEAALFADKGQALRSFFATQLPDARAKTLQGKNSAGEVFQIYLKLAYNALYISECYRDTFRTPQGTNMLDAILAVQKINLQEILYTSLVTYGLQKSGLQKDELTILRRQFLIIGENEYYLLKFQPELRAYFRAETRKTEDDASFYQYINEIVAQQSEKTPLPVFTPKTASFPKFLASHIEGYDSVYAHAFATGEEILSTLSSSHLHHAYLIGSALLAGIVLSLGINLVITQSTRRTLVNVSKNVAEASDDVDSASSHLVSASDQISRDATQYASAIDSISASLNEVTAVAEANKNQAAIAAGTTTRAKDSVDQGLQTIQELDTAINSARSSGHRINQVISRINDLSFQTNLLALNAAVEAALAGEAGAGFAVVADEVRRLAQSCAEASKETAELIGDSSKDTATAITKSDELAERFKNVSVSIHEVNEIVTLLSTNFLQQASGVSEINRSVSEQGEIAQSLAAAAEETASTAFSMESQVKSLKESVDRMNLLLGERG